MLTAIAIVQGAVLTFFFSSLNIVSPHTSTPSLLVFTFGLSALVLLALFG